MSSAPFRKVAATVIRPPEKGKALKVDRFPENPLITPAQIRPSRPDFEVIGVFNAGVARLGDETILLMRVAERPIADDPSVALLPRLDLSGAQPQIVVERYRRDEPGVDFHDPRVVAFPDGLMLTSISHLRLARSRDGRRFAVEDQPALAPERANELYGLEDPRITEIDGVFHIVYKAVSPDGIVQALATTRDFVSFRREGVMFCPENMDAMLFPARVGGRYVALHRPVGAMLGGPMMWLAYGESPLAMGDHRFLLGPGAGGWDSGRVGGGAVPFLTSRGWLEIYHAATPDDHYCLGGMLLDIREPHRVLARSTRPIMQPEAPYETAGFVPDVVFTCGALVDGDTVTIYYGAADTCIAAARMSVSGILASLDEA